MRAPDFDLPDFPGYFVLSEACEMRNDRLHYRNAPVSGAVVKRGLVDEKGIRVTIESFQDGVSIGPWIDPILGIDTTSTFVATDFSLRTADGTAFIEHHTHSVTGLWPNSGIERTSYSLDADSNIVSVQGLSLRSDDNVHVTGSWYRFPRERSVVVVVKERSGERRSTAAVGFDRDGCICELSISGPYWQDVDEFAIASDRWIPTNIAQILAFDPSATLSLVKLDGCEAQIAAHASEWLKPVTTLQSVTSDFDFEGFRDILAATDVHAIELPSLTTEDSLARDPDRQIWDDQLVGLALQFMRERPGRMVKFPTQTFAPISAIGAQRTDSVGDSVLVFDDQGEEVIAAELSVLRPAVLNLIDKSPKLEFVHHKSSNTQVRPELLQIAQANPQAQIFHRWKPIDGKSAPPRPSEAAALNPDGKDIHPDVYPLFNLWLAERRSLSRPPH